MSRFDSPPGLVPAVRRGIGRVLLFILLAAFSARAPAITLDRSIQELQHTAWSVRQGAPSEIDALAQSADGFLWISSEGGLVRFDGLHFLRDDPVTGQPYSKPNVRSLYAPPSGGLWVGYQGGGVFFLKDGKTTAYTTAEGLIHGTILALAEDRAGILWAAGATGLCRFRNGRFETVPIDPGPEHINVYSLLADRAGNLWIGTDRDLRVLRPGASSVVVAGTFLNPVLSIAEMPDGSLWLADFREFVTAVVPTADGVTVRTRLHAASTGLAVDADGSLWVTTVDKGLRRLRQPADIHDALVEDGDARVESFTQGEGLSGDAAWPVLIDREGNLWVGTSRGIDRFSDGPLVTAPLPAGAHDIALAAGDDGAIWVGTDHLPLMLLRGRTVKTYPDVGAEIGTARRSADGSVWFAGAGGLYRARGDQVQLVAPRPEAMHGEIATLDLDSQGNVWLCAYNSRKWFEWSGGQWNALGLVHGPSAENVLWDRFTDSLGRLWSAYKGNAVTLTDGQSTRLLSNKDDVAAGHVMQFAPAAKAPGFWLGTEKGLLYFDGGALHSMVTAGAANELVGVSGVVDTGAHGLWLRVNSGILNVPGDEVRRFITDSAHAVSARRFDFLDGLPGSSTLDYPLPTMVQGSDGRIWQATSAGVVWIDPARIPENKLPPPVTIDAVRSGDQSYSAAGLIGLPAHTSRLQIDYTAPTLTVPERARFRYKLEGLDRDWQEAGDRRQAIYTNLGPGRYLFRVIAANESGVWSSQGAEVSFDIEPSFLQTRLCAALGVAAAILLLWLLYQLRMTQVLRRIRVLFQERLVERERIARELHDTLLQGVQGLIFEIRGAVNDLDEASPRRQHLNEALVRANQMLAEGRDQVQGLRSGGTIGGNLDETIADLVRGLRKEQSCSIRLTTEGTPRPLNAEVQDQIHRIVGEALTNTLNHATATEVVLDIVFAPKRLRVHLRDNGVGIPEEVMKAGNKAGHWGLPGMRERAEGMRGRLSIESQPGHGTGIDLVIPASIAFRDRTRLSPWLRWWRRRPFWRRKPEY